VSAFDLTGRRALVTGGAQGLGEGIARALTAAGAAVMIADIAKDLGEKTAAAIGAGFVALDVTDDAAGWETAVAQLTRTATRPRADRARFDLLEIE
jgi:NAD(P)-dependent dehydrogenase (short-subunit alcohol dehydrogenase family)